MKSYVVDASVVAEAILRDSLADVAVRVLTGGHVMLAPNLIYAEVAHVLKKKCVGGLLDELDAQVSLAEVRRLPLKITPCGELAESALRLALDTKRSAYDCMYLALAENTDTVMVSADKRFTNALANTPWAKHVVWLGDM